MNKNILVYLSAFACFLLVPMACRHSDDELAHHHHDHTAEGENHFGKEIIVEPETAELFGVVTDTIVPGDFHEVIKVTGRIVDTPSSVSVVSAPTAGIVRFSAGMQEGSQVKAGTAIASISADGISGGDSNKAQKAAIDAARRELDRLRPLYEEGIVSAKDYNAALQAYELAKSQYSGAAASGTARSVGAGVISQMLVSNGQYVEAGAPVATVSANSRLTLRADVPDRYASRVPLIESARMAVPGADVVDLADMGGKRVSETSSRLSPGYIPVFFTFESNGRVLPQTMAEVYLTGAPRSGVITVPVEAVVEQLGQYFVFVKVDEEGYVKTPVKLGATDGERTEIISGIVPGDCVVVKGATTVRLAETGSAVPEGHSHSH